MLFKFNEFYLCTFLGMNFVPTVYYGHCSDGFVSLGNIHGTRSSYMEEDA